MAKGYVLFSETINDQEGYDAYLQKALPTVFASGGRPIVAQDGPETIEGNWQASRIVVLEFESVDAAHKWYKSPAYQAVIGERQRSADAMAVIVSGI